MTEKETKNVNIDGNAHAQLNIQYKYKNNLQMSPVSMLCRFHLLLQGQRVLEVQQPQAAGGARLPSLHPQRLHGMRPHAHRSRYAADGGRRCGD